MNLEAGFNGEQVSIMGILVDSFTNQPLRNATIRMQRGNVLNKIPLYLAYETSTQDDGTFDLKINADKQVQYYLESLYPKYLSGRTCNYFFFLNFGRYFNKSP